MKSSLGFLASGLLAVLAVPAGADDRGDIANDRLDARGERINERLDHRGHRIARRVDRRR